MGFLQLYLLDLGLALSVACAIVTPRSLDARMTRDLARGFDIAVRVRVGREACPSRTMVACVGGEGIRAPP
jgi:hypothetical protein